MDHGGNEFRRVEIEYEYRPGTPACVLGRAEDCDPGEPGELGAITVTDATTGELLELTYRQEQQVVVWCYDHAAQEEMR